MAVRPRVELSIDKECLRQGDDGIIMSVRDSEQQTNVLPQNDIRKDEAATAATTTTSSSGCHHEAQWDRQGEWLTKLRTHKTKLVEEQRLQGWELWEAMSTLSLEHKIATLHGRNNRCPHCWHDQHYCICARLSEPIRHLPLKWPAIHIKLCLLMHCKEYMGAGNSAKLMMQLLPQQTELYLYGKTGELDRLLEEVAMSDPKDVMILWPSADALSVSDYLTRSHCGDDGGYKTTDHSPKTIRAIVLDGTYSQARNMYKSLRKRVNFDDSIATVAVYGGVSVFHRAKKNYGKAHLQQQQETNSATRICTAEACAWLLLDLGAAPSVSQSITDAVILNNEALAYARAHQKVGRS
jgi:DTW domain-containing protein YfiP